MDLHQRSQHDDRASSRSDTPSRQAAQFGQAVEPLAAPGERPGPTTQSVEIDRWYRGDARCRDLANGHPLAMANDLTAQLVGPFAGLAERRHPDRVDASLRAATSPQSISRAIASSASAIDDVSPVDRIPPRHTYRRSGVG